MILSMNHCHFLFCFFIAYFIFDHSIAMQIQTNILSTAKTDTTATNVYPALEWSYLALGIGAYFSICLILYLISHFMLQQQEEDQNLPEQSVKTVKIYVNDSKPLIDEQPKENITANRESIIVTLDSQYGTKDDDDSRSALEKIKSKELAGKTAREKKKLPPKLFTEREQKTQEDMTMSVRVNIEADRVDTSYDFRLPSFPKSPRSTNIIASSKSGGIENTKSDGNKRSSRRTYSTTSSSTTSGTDTPSTITSSSRSSGSSSTMDSSGSSTTESSNTYSSSSQTITTSSSMSISTEDSTHETKKP